MVLQEAIDKKRKLEDYMHVMLAEFEEQTGLSVIEVLIGRMDTGAMGEGRSSVISDVALRIEIDPITEQRVVGGVEV